MGAQAHRIMEEAGYMDDIPRSDKLRKLLLLDTTPRSPKERLEDEIGEELARFLVAALAESQGRPGSSSP